MIHTAHQINRARLANAQYGIAPAGLALTATPQDVLIAIADAYDALPDYDPAAVPAWRALADETRNQFRALKRAGLAFRVTAEDPYPVAAELFAAVEGGEIAVLSTRTTGGHPYWDDATNDVFRAVHDVMGHAATGRGFDRHGEARAYEHHAASFSPLARQALATELRGQAAYLAVRGESPEQKIAILPREIRDLSACFLMVPSVAHTEYGKDALARHAAGGLQIAS